MTEYVTREEHLATIARLDAADAELRASMANVERSLRTDYESKIGAAVGGLSATIDTRFDKVDATLAQQNKVLFKPKFSLGDIQGSYLITIVLASVSAALLLHYVFHVG